MLRPRLPRLRTLEFSGSPYMTVTDSRPATFATSGEPARRTGRWIDDWRPEEPEFWETSGRQVGPAEPGLVDLRRAPGLLGVADLERELGVPGLDGLQLQPAAAVPARSRCRTWWARCCGCRTRSRCRSSAAATGRWSAPALLLVPTLRLRGRGAEPGHAVLAVLPDRGDRGLGGGNFAALDGQHQLLLPGRPRRARRSA